MAIHPPEYGKRQVQAFQRFAESLGIDPGRVNLDVGMTIESVGSRDATVSIQLVPWRVEDMTADQRAALDELVEACG